MTIAWAVLATEAIAAPGGDAAIAYVEGAAREVVSGTNVFRRSRQLQPLSFNPSLQAAARDFADYMARNERYGHEADGRTPPERVRAHGYDYCAIAENLGRIQRTSNTADGELARAFVDGWIASPQHLKAMVDAEASETAVAIVRGRNGQYYGVQLIGRPRSESITVQVANRGPLAVRYEIGERAYQLASRTAHTHTLCSPSPLVMTFPGGAVERALPLDGQRYTARQAKDGHWALVAD